MKVKNYKKFITINKMGKEIITFGDIEVEKQILPIQKPNFNL